MVGTGGKKTKNPRPSITASFTTYRYFFGGTTGAQKLRVTYGPLEVNDPRVTQVRFKNTGKQVIDEADFLGQPYEIARSNATLLDYNVVEQSTRNLVDKLEQVDAKPETLNVYPKTLNRGDWFTVQLIYDGGASDHPPTVTGRIRDRTRESAYLSNTL